MRSARKIICIDESQHWADYAELQRPPRPNVRMTRTDKCFWAGLAILCAAAAFAFLYVVVIQGIRGL
jgi:hypothetical protein